MWRAEVRLLERRGTELKEIEYLAEAFQDRRRAVQFIEATAKDWQFGRLALPQNYLEGLNLQLDRGDQVLVISLAYRQDEKVFPWGMIIYLDAHTEDGDREGSMVHPLTLKDREAAIGALRSLLDALPIAEASRIFFDSLLEMKDVKYSLAVDVFAHEEVE